MLAFETELAKASRPRQEMRDFERLYNKIDVAGLEELTPSLPWSAYFTAIGYPDVVDLSVATPEFFERFRAKMFVVRDAEQLRLALRLAREAANRSR